MIPFSATYIIRAGILKIPGSIFVITIFETPKASSYRLLCLPAHWVDLPPSAVSAPAVPAVAAPVVVVALLSGPAVSPARDSVAREPAAEPAQSHAAAPTAEIAADAALSAAAAAAATPVVAEHSAPARVGFAFAFSARVAPAAVVAVVVG